MTMSASVKKGASAKPSHPSWIDMIKDCIIAHPEDSRSGVSRSTIKKFVEAKYKITMDASHSSQLARAIVSGSDKGIFVLPKGPSGKVKLSPDANAGAVMGSKRVQKKDIKHLKTGTGSGKKSSTTKSSEANVTGNKRSVSEGPHTKEQVMKKPVAKAEAKTLAKTPHARAGRKSISSSPAKKSTGKVERLEKGASSEESNTKKAIARKTGSVPKAKGKAKI